MSWKSWPTLPDRACPLLRARNGRLPGLFHVEQMAKLPVISRGIRRKLRYDPSRADANGIPCRHTSLCARP